MSFALFMGMSAAMSSESVATALDKQVTPLMTVYEKVHQYTPLGLLTDWIDFQTTEAEIWKPSDEAMDAIYQQMVKRLGLAMEWRAAPALALLPWQGQGAWDALYEETLGAPDDFSARHKEKYGRLPFSEDPETQALYREFFESDREVSDDAKEDEGFYDREA